MERMAPTLFSRSAVQLVGHCQVPRVGSVWLFVARSTGFANAASLSDMGLRKRSHAKAFDVRFGKAVRSSQHRVSSGSNQAVNADAQNCRASSKVLRRSWVSAKFKVSQVAGYGYR